VRDRDVRTAVQTLLEATGAFDSGAVWLWGLPEDYGTGTSLQAAVAIDPVSSTQDDRWDSEPGGGIVIASMLKLTFLYRNDDPQLRDEGAELLMDTAANALNGVSLAGLSMPGLTRFLNWSWNPPAPPERRITAMFSYQYLLDGWQSYDETP
jgi:hypothetical protein